MHLGWKRQKSFVETYIRHARRAAWGDDSAIGAIPGIDGVAANPYPATSQDDGPTTLNRRQKRLQEKESRKEKEGGRLKGSKKSTEGTQAKADSAGRSRARKRVQAENGKLLIVDSAGNVFLEEENENGEKEEYLLDPDEIPKPTIQQTLVFQLPLWLYSKTKNKFCLIFSNAERGQALEKDK